TTDAVRGRAVTEPDGTGVRLFPPAVMAAGFGVGLLLHWIVPWRIAPPQWDSEVRFTGAGICAAAILLSFWAFMQFRRAGTSPDPRGPVSVLVPRGPYRFTRNPMYFGLTLFQAGASLLMNTVWPLITLPFVVLVLRRAVIAKEEAYLEAKFGED